MAENPVVEALRGHARPESQTRCPRCVDAIPIAEAQAAELTKLREQVKWLGPKRNRMMAEAQARVVEAASRVASFLANEWPELHPPDAFVDLDTALSALDQLEKNGG